MESLFKWIVLEFLSEDRFSSETFLSFAVTMGQVVANHSNITDCVVIGDEAMKSYTPLETTLIATVTGLLCATTIIGNVLVIVSFNIDRRLQTDNNVFLLSLAVADFCIGVFSMPLFTTYILMQGWRLGPITCDLWLALDYLCSNASVLSLLMISFDRYFSVKNPLKYRAKRTRRVVYRMIGLAWLISFITWPPWILAWPYIDGKRSVPEDRCYIQFLQTNSYITFITALIAFYVPVMIMSHLYYKIWRMTEERKKYIADMLNLEREEPAGPNLPDRSRVQRLKEFLIDLCSICCDDEVEDDSLSPGGNTPSSGETPIQSSRTTSVTLRPDQIAYLDAVISQENESVPPADSIYTVLIRFPEQNTSEPELRPSVTMIPGELPRLPAPMKASLSTSALMAHAVASSNNPALTRCSSSDALSAARLVTGRPPRLPRPNLKKKDLRTTEKKATDTKAARTLSAILLAFIITWTPYNVLVLVKSVETLLTCDDLIPQILWDFSYYLCYINSMVNPICYALANANFRKTYWRILTCTWRKQSKLSIIRGLHSRAS